MSTVTTPAPATPGPAVPAATGLAGRARWKQPVVLGVLALVSLVCFALLPAGGLRATFVLALGSEAVELSPVSVPSRAAALVLSLLCLAVAVWSALLARAGRRTPGWATALFGVAWILAFLCWAVAGRSIPFTGLLRGTLLLAVPLVFGAMAGILCERAGVINIAIEGQLLAGAFASAVLASLTDSAYVGLLAAPVAGLVVGALLGLFALRYQVDQTIVGVVLNVLVIGFTSFLYGQLLVPQADALNTPPVLRPLAVPLLSDIPVVGPVVFDQTLIVYLMYALVAVVNVALFRTRWGLRVRAVGEHPKAADTLGVRVLAVRWRSVLLGGAVAGLGGAFFTLGRVGAFGEEMTAGQGFIAIAAMIFGRWKPLGALGAALLFGFASSLQQTLGTLSGFPIPGQLLLMLPYLATVLAVAGLVGRVRAPAADGVPYGKG